VEKGEGKVRRTRRDGIEEVELRKKRARRWSGEDEGTYRRERAC